MIYRSWWRLSLVLAVTGICCVGQQAPVVAVAGPSKSVALGAVLSRPVVQKISAGAWDHPFNQAQQTTVEDRQNDKNEA